MTDNIAKITKEMLIAMCETASFAECHELEDGSLRINGLFDESSLLFDFNENNEVIRIF